MPIKNGHTPYMHSFAHTPNYIVVFEFPLFWEIMKITMSTKILPAMKWTPENGTAVHNNEARRFVVVFTIFVHNIV
jgi:carotenoid cleavage dioxygenase-like enzyme